MSLLDLRLQKEHTDCFILNSRVNWINTFIRILYNFCVLCYIISTLIFNSPSKNNLNINTSFQRYIIRVAQYMLLTRDFLDLGTLKFKYYFSIQNNPLVRVGKIPWRRKWQPTPVFLPGKFHGQRSLVGYSEWGPKEPYTTGQPN